MSVVGRREISARTDRTLRRRHVDSAQVYKNEAEVGEAVVESGLKREEVFISMFLT